MVKVPTKIFDPAEYIETPEDAAIMLTDALESGDSAIVAATLGAIVRAEGASEMARKTGISRASLYSALREGGNPTLSTVLKLLKALELSLSVKSIPENNVVSFFNYHDFGVAA